MERREEGKERGGETRKTGEKNKGERKKESEPMPWFGQKTGQTANTIIWP